MSHSCYWNISSISPAAVGPPAKLGVSVQYIIVDTVANQLDKPDAGGGAYVGTASANVSLPATQAEIITASQAAIQAGETSYPLLTFIAVLE